MKKACSSNKKDASTRSNKSCVCGGHSQRSKKPRNKKHRAVKPTTLMENYRDPGY